MRVVIAGAGSVGRSIATELIRNGHQLLLIDRYADGERVAKVPEAAWLQADACELSALNEAGVEYEVVKGPLSRRKRDDLARLSGGRLYPVIQFSDGSIYREQSKDMAATIKAGKLYEKQAGGQPSG